MSTLVDLGTYIAGQGFGTLGEDIKLSQLADIPDNQIALVLYDAAGGLEAMTMSPLVKTIVPRVQVNVRHKVYATAESNAMALWNNLIQVREVNLPPSNERYIVIQPIGTPAPFNRDEKARVIFVFNLEVAKVQP